MKYSIHGGPPLHQTSYLMPSRHRSRWTLQGVLATVVAAAVFMAMTTYTPTL